MNRLCVLAIGVVVVTLAAGDAAAQPPAPGGRPATRPPTYSPYLNLLRGGSLTLNYYGLVRPEQQFRRSIQNLATDVALNAQDIGSLETGRGELPPTGHPTMFMNHGAYFMNSAGGGGGSRYGSPGAVNLPRPNTGVTMPTLPPRR